MPNVRQGAVSVVEAKLTGKVDDAVALTAECRSESLVRQRPEGDRLRFPASVENSGSPASRLPSSHCLPASLGSCRRPRRRASPSHLTPSRPLRSSRRSSPVGSMMPSALIAKRPFRNAWLGEGSEGNRLVALRYLETLIHRRRRRPVRVPTLIRLDGTRPHRY